MWSMSMYLCFDILLMFIYIYNSWYSIGFICFLQCMSLRRSPLVWTTARSSHRVRRSMPLSYASSWTRKGRKEWPEPLGAQGEKWRAILREDTHSPLQITVVSEVRSQNPQKMACMDRTPCKTRYVGVFHLLWNRSIKDMGRVTFVGRSSFMRPIRTDSYSGQICGVVLD